MELEATVAELAPRVLRYCLGQTAAPEVAEEVAQDALAALVGRWRRHGPPESPEAFVFAVARRRAFRAGLLRRLLLPLSAISDGHGGSGRSLLEETPGPGVEERAAARSELSRALGALGRLPARDREALLLVAALGAAAALVVLLGGLLLSALRPATDRGAPAAVARFHVTNRDGVIVVRDADGGAAFLYARERPSEPPRGMRMIVLGGTRP